MHFHVSVKNMVQVEDSLYVHLAMSSFSAKENVHDMTEKHTVHDNLALNHVRVKCNKKNTNVLSGSIFWLILNIVVHCVVMNQFKTKNIHISS